MCHMADNRLLKAIFYGQIALGQRSHGRPLKRYKVCLKATLKECSIDLDTWENEALNPGDKCATKGSSNLRKELKLLWKDVRKGRPVRRRLEPLYSMWMPLCCPDWTNCALSLTQQERINSSINDRRIHHDECMASLAYFGTFSLKVYR